MNPEMLTTYQITLGGLALIAYSFLWSFGGRDGTSKAWRRWVGSFIMVAAVNGLFIWRGSWSPWLLLMWPVLGGASTMGYGADTTGDKIIRRSVFAAGVVAAGLIPAIMISGAAWLVFGLQAASGALSVVLGVKNPVKAAAEEFLVCMVLSLFLIGYPFVL